MTNEEMGFPDTFEEFINEYSFEDRDKVYTNGSELIPAFRVLQGYEHFTNKIREKEREMAITDDIEKSNFDTLMFKNCTDTAYQCGYEKGKKEARQEAFKEVLDTMREIYSADLHCMADMCESPDEGRKCDSCMYFAIKSAIKALSEGKDTNVPTKKEGE